MSHLAVIIGSFVLAFSGKPETVYLDNDNLLCLPHRVQPWQDKIMLDCAIFRGCKFDIDGRGSFIQTYGPDRRHCA